MKHKTNQFIYEEKEMLKNIFEKRENDIYNITESERELNKKKTKDYEKIDIAIDNIPNGFKEVRQGMKASVENYIDTLSLIQSNENEKFYKAGFSDAVKLIVDCLCQKKEL